MGAAVVAVALLGVGAWALTHGSSPVLGARGPLGAPSPAVTPKVPNRPPFFFRITNQRPAKAGKLGAAAAGDASIEIGARLSTFYDTVFMDPTTWAKGVPETAWTLFDPSVRDRAMAAASAFTLGDQAASLAKLSVTTSSLTVKVLLDPAGQPAAAVTQVEFAATGQLEDGQMVKVTSEGSLLLRLEAGRWFVFGYPSADTKIQSVAPTPTPSPSSGGSPARSPSGSPSP
jgi:hypothetical protein